MFVIIFLIIIGELWLNLFRFTLLNEKIVPINVIKSLDCDKNYGVTEVI